MLARSSRPSVGRRSPVSVTGTGSRLDASSGATRIRPCGGGGLGPRGRAGAGGGTRRGSSGEHLRCRRCSADVGAWPARRDHRADRPCRARSWGAAVRRGVGSSSQAGAHVRRYQRGAHGHALSSGQAADKLGPARHHRRSRARFASFRNRRGRATPASRPRFAMPENTPSRSSTTASPTTPSGPRRRARARQS